MSKNQPNQNEFLRKTAFAELNGVRATVVNFYAEIGLLPYTQLAPRRCKYYDIKVASKRLKEILKLREKGKSVLEIEKILKDKK